MRRLVRLVARLYPPAWRHRYAREFEALIDDLEPGWRELFDVMIGAITMQVRTLGIPAILAVAGALAGGLVAMRMPQVYAASGTIRLAAGDVSGDGASLARQLQASLDAALDGSSDARAATSLTLLDGRSAHPTVQVTYENRDPIQAQRVAAKLTAVLASGNPAAGLSAEVLESPRLPTSPEGFTYPTAASSGAVFGLVAGGLLVLFRARRSPGAVGL